MIDQSHPLHPGRSLHPVPAGKHEWVKFIADLPPHAHRCPEGYCVGIYVPDYVDVQGDFVAEHIAAVDIDGDNLLPFPAHVLGKLEDVKAELRPLYEEDAANPGFLKLKVRMDAIRLDVSKVSNLHHLEDWDHLPKTRADKTRKEIPDAQTPAWHRRQQANALKAKRDAVETMAKAMAAA